MQKKRLCLSPCLLGTPCRYDGRSKAVDLSSLPLDELELIPFCPECAAGFGCPREPIEVVAPSTPDAPPSIKVVRGHCDVTAPLHKACLSQLEAFMQTALPDAFLLKARSPSCGKASPLHDEAGKIIGTAPGEWARLLMEKLPEIPLFSEEELPDLLRALSENSHPEK